jgi:hypothetical protein
MGLLRLWNSPRLVTLRLALSWTRWRRSRAATRRARRKRRLLALQALVTQQLLLLAREEQALMLERVLAQLEQMPQVPVPPPPPEPLPTPQPPPEQEEPAARVPDLVAISQLPPMPSAEEQLASLLTGPLTPASSSPSSPS